MRRPLATFVAVALTTTVLASLAEARVVRLVVEQKRVFADGQSFGDVGPYERLDGTVYFEVDPTDPLNAVIVNLDKAPKNAAKKVEFSSPFFMLKPVDMSKGNGKILYGVNNRGNKLESGLRWNYKAASNNPISAADAGDGFLMKLGYTVVDAGWQGDVDPANHRLSPKFPVAVNTDGSPVVARIRVELSDREIPAAGTFSLPLKGSANFKPYATADFNTAKATLTVRSAVNGPKTPIAPDAWAFGTCKDGRASLVQSPIHVCLFEGFKVDRLYELTYLAKDPLVMGLGYAVTRDLASFLRNQAKDEAGNPNPLALGATSVGIKRVYGAGSSSTGMYMRDFLYLGFNEDEAHRKVFDAVNIHIPGTHRLLANVQFADPNTYSRQDDRFDFISTSYPPLTFAVTTDPISGIKDGILKRPKTDPLVFQTDTENEFWTFKASLNVHDGLGKPVAVPDTVRLYYLSNFQHSGGDPSLAVPGKLAMCANPTNPNYHGPTQRALLMALDAWADKGVAPPKSNYPRVEDGTLVTLEEYKKSFPAIPGLAMASVVTELFFHNFGPKFRSTGGIVTDQTPVRGKPYQVLVPKVDKDGLNVSGVRQMEVRVPLGTNIGWNVRASGRREGSLCGLNGSFLPFATTKDERLKSGDPRLSLQERYKDHDGYVAAVKKAASDLQAEGFLRAEDAERFVRDAEQGHVLHH